MINDLPVDEDYFQTDEERESAESEESFNLQLKKSILSSPPTLACCREYFLLACLDDRHHPPTLALPHVLRQMPGSSSVALLPSWFFSPEDHRTSFPQLFSDIPRELPAKKILEVRERRMNPAHFEDVRLHCLRSFIRGLFARGGYCQSPQESYHLEIPLYNDRVQSFFTLAARKLRIPFKTFLRRGEPGAYMKNRDGLRRFFQVLELYDEIPGFDDLLATRNLLAHVNRQVNFETANIQKSVTASERLIQQILELLARPDQNFWTDALYDLACKRLEFPLDSLENLGKRCRPFLTKSAVNHRLRRISVLYSTVFGPRPQTGFTDLGISDEG